MYTTFMDSFRGALFKYFLLSLPLFYGGYVDIMFFFPRHLYMNPLTLVSLRYAISNGGSYDFHAN